MKILSYIAVFFSACVIGTGEKSSFAETPDLTDKHPELTKAKQSTEDPIWDPIFKERMGWWSLQPIATVEIPESNSDQWSMNEVDRFVRSSLIANELSPVEKAHPRQLVRRLSFALTGLPPEPKTVEAYADNPTPEAYKSLVQSLLDSPHFGERWARHWMDVVHYSDTHGYEWDTPAKNAWMYRDYLIRAYNNDVPYRQLVFEQIAGDLIEPRINTDLNLNESILGPMSMRLGERRHGDNSQTEGVTQEAVANVIDTVSKSFLATTVACAQCHDHKLDAVAQKDYYSLAGVIMSSRWGVRMADAQDPNEGVIEEMKGIKTELTAMMKELWRDSLSEVTENILADLDVPEEKPETNTAKKRKTLAFPESLPDMVEYVVAQSRKEDGSLLLAWQQLKHRYLQERTRRMAQNSHPRTLIADFTGESIPEGWRIDGYGMKNGLVKDGAIVIADEGERIVEQILPAGRWSHVWSKRLSGAVRSPRFPQDPPPTISVEFAGAQYSALSMNVDNAFHTERMKFLKTPSLGWYTSKTGNLVALAAGADTMPRQVYFEMVTKSLNNYYPPRDNYGGLSQDIENDPRSWFGLTKVYETTEGDAPVDSLNRYEILFAKTLTPTQPEELALRIAVEIMKAVDSWRNGTASTDEIRIINEALSANWLPNSSGLGGQMDTVVKRYRTTEKQLHPSKVIGSIDDWNEGIDIPMGVRGSYTDFGEKVPRGTIRFLESLGTHPGTTSSGRLELAQNFIHQDNPLVARVYVNRVWHHLFGAGLVRTVDDFGHLGETPSHPELLDWLSIWFMENNWSTKKLIHLLVSSSTWQQSSLAQKDATVSDPENRLWHHMPMRRLEAEAIWDSMLAVSGRLDHALYGEPINPHRAAEDSTKRLYAGPLDGNGRRSIYQKMTLMDPPKFLALFNQPIPKLTTGRRDTTNVPNQALAMLNNPFVNSMAQHWSQGLMQDQAETSAERVSSMYIKAFGTPPDSKTIEGFIAFANECANLHGATEQPLLENQRVWQDVAHAMFNMKEFIYVQ